MNVEIERTAEALDQRHRAGLCRIRSATGWVNQIARNHPLDDAEHCADDVRLPVSKINLTPISFAIPLPYAR